MSVIKYWAAFFSFALFPRLNFGGGSSSDTQTKTSTSTTNNVSTADKRLVTSEDGMATSGDHNTLAKITSDSHNIAYNDNSTKTDFGSVSAALSGITQTADKAINLGQFGINGAVDILKKASDNSASLDSQLISFASQSSANAMTSSRDIMGLSSSVNSAVAGAYANQADTANGNKKIMYVALGIMGLVAVKMFSNKAA